jgi:hypothetical protein
MLLLGESHYDWPKRPKAFNLKMLTQRVIHDEVTGEQTHQAMRQIIVACGGSNESKATRGRFWDSVVFCNYLRYLLPNRTSKKDSVLWQLSQPAFLICLRRYKPHLVIVFSQEVWRHLPDTANGFDIAAGKNIRGRETKGFSWDRRHRAIAICIPHPFSWHFRKDSLVAARDWIPVIKDAKRACLR